MIPKSLAAAALVLLATAVPAAADSIAYVKDNNIWLTNPDGSGQVQVTHDGTPAVPYRSPSQADDGTIAAGHGNEIARLAQSGQLLSHFTPPPATDSIGHTVQDVPQQVAISPNGARVAFVYSDPSCPPGVSCGVRQVMLYSYADRATPVSTFGELTNLRNPSWIDNDRMLVFGGHEEQVNIDSPGGSDDDAVHWFEDAGNEDVGDGELSRQGDRLALVRSYGDDTHLAVYHVPGTPGGATPEAACFSGTDAAISGPSWSPDGSRLAFVDSEGIQVLPLPVVLAGDCPGATSSHVIVPGGAEPDWGPASIQPGAGSWTDGSSGGSGGSGSSGGSEGSGSSGGSAGSGHRGAGAGIGRAKARIALRLPKAFSLRAAQRAGVRLRITVPVAGRVAVTAALGRRVMGRGTAKARKAATVTVKLRLSGASVRRIHRAHATRLHLAVTLAPSSGGKRMTAATKIPIAG